MWTQRTPSNGSGSIISGVPKVAVEFAGLEERVLNALQAAAQDAATRYELHLQSKARESWGDTAAGISVNVGDDLVMTIGVVDEVAEEAQLLEYGTPDKAPAAVLRMAAVEANNKLSPMITKALQEGLK
jgi:hypothetical protein